MKTILVVDDDPHFRRSLVIGLETMGFKVFEAEGGIEALEFLQKNRKSASQISYAVVDARMPGLDGFWLTDQMTLLYPSIRVVILSAHSYPVPLGRYSVLTKPVRIANLVNVLNGKVRCIKEGSVS